MPVASPSATAGAEKEVKKARERLVAMESEVPIPGVLKARVASEVRSIAPPTTDAPMRVTISGLVLRKVATFSNNSS